MINLFFEHPSVTQEMGSQADEAQKESLMKLLRLLTVLNPKGDISQMAKRVQADALWTGTSLHPNEKTRTSHGCEQVNIAIPCQGGAPARMQLYGWHCEPSRWGVGLGSGLEFAFERLPRGAALRMTHTFLESLEMNRQGGNSIFN